MKLMSILLGACLSAALLTACGGSKSLPLGPSSALTSGFDVPASSSRAHSAVEYKTIYEFRGPAAGDGSNPEDELTSLNGVLYGTTSKGGKHDRGTVLKISTDGSGEAVLHDFGHTEDEPRYPTSGLLNVSGTLYGTTEFGNGDFGAVYKIASSGAPEYKQIFGFGGTNGRHPRAGVIYVGGKLYGTTLSGESKNCGGVFQMSLTGQDVRTTGFDCTNGHNPWGSLLDDDGYIYGTTVYGGSASDPGTVFLFHGDRILSHFSFKGEGSPKYLNSGLILIDGKLYGTSRGGGKYGGGTIFEISTFPFKNLMKLHDFGAPGDGAQPFARLINVGGALYGTTIRGGKYKEGIVFKVSTDGKDYTKLHDFGGPGDGATPVAGLIDVHGALYGTAAGGGKLDPQCPETGRSAKGCGTIFSLSGI